MIFPAIHQARAQAVFEEFVTLNGDSHTNNIPRWHQWNFDKNNTQIYGGLAASSFS
jgi:hypothetical protein